MRRNNKLQEARNEFEEHFALACKRGDHWGLDVFAVVSDRVRLELVPLHPLLRRSATLSYTRRWWSILAMGAQSATIDCILVFSMNIAPRSADSAELLKHTSASILYGERVTH